jgi:hypothetical protein
VPHIQTTTKETAEALAESKKRREDIGDMKLSGTRFDDPNWEATHRVTEAIVTPERVALDWIENGVRYHLLAQSRDGGLTYQGSYGMFRPEEQWGIELTRYTATDGSVLLSADWHEKDTGNEGSSLFALKPQ